MTFYGLKPIAVLAVLQTHQSINDEWCRSIIGEPQVFEKDLKPKQNHWQLNEHHPTDRLPYQTELTAIKYNRASVHSF